MVKRILLSDDDDKLEVEWTQCENERATSSVEDVGRLVGWEQLRLGGVG